MADKWYFKRDGEQSGPFSAAQLQELAVDGQLRPQDSVWKEGMLKGVPAAKVRHLFADVRLLTPASGSTKGRQAGSTEGRQAGPAAQAPTVPAPSPPAPPPISTTASGPPGPPAPPTALAVRLASPEDLELAPDADSPAVGPTAAGLGAENRPVPQGKEPRPQQQAAARPLRVLGVKGGILSSQDGARVKYRKQCLRCGYTDTSMTTMPIRRGVTLASFFCPKCKKSQQVAIQGVG